MIDIEKAAHELAMLDARNITTSVTSALKQFEPEDNNSKIAQKYFQTYNAIKNELEKLSSNKY